MYLVQLLFLLLVKRFRVRMEMQREPKWPKMEG